MKNKIFITGLCAALSLLFLFNSCKKEEIMIYEPSAAVYFSEYSRTYTFVENMDRLEIGNDTLKIPVQISGMTADYKRTVRMEVVESDTLNTASKEMYRLIDGYVNAQNYKGYVPVRINYTKDLDDSVYVLRVRLVATEDFPGVDLEKKVISISMTNKLTEPSNWRRLKSSFGPYSDSWYRFILLKTGLASIPYWSYNGSADSNNPDPEKWTMTYAEMKAYAALTKVELDKYNRSPKGPLLHEDGPQKDKPVMMP
ncbi:MAG: DUF4843 domain-containing protein [Odoribacter sp.]